VIIRKASNKPGISEAEVVRRALESFALLTHPQVRSVLLLRDKRLEREHMIKALLGLGVLIIGAASTSAEEMHDMRFLSGSCDATAHTAEGPVGSDLTKRQSRYFCDSAVIGFFGPLNTHVLVQFAEKKSHHGQILGFGGAMEGKDILNVDHIYLIQGKPTPVDDGACKFFFMNGRLTSLFCGAKIDEGGRRTVAAIGFHVSSEK